MGAREPAEQGGPAGFSGLEQCGSVWACPECAPRIAAERALEISRCIRYVVNEHRGTVLHATFTLSHHNGQSLKKTWDAVQAAWGHVTKGRAWCETVKGRYDVLGYCRGFEATWGKTNGWHPHLHVLIFLGDRIEAAEATAISERLYTAYLAGLRKKGFTADKEHGVKVDIATTRRGAERVLGKYLTKIASEITRHDQKTSSGGRFTPFDLLEAVVETEDPALLEKWIEWEQASFGRRQLTWGGNVRALADLGAERSDGEIVEDDEGERDAFMIPNDSWVLIREHSDELLEAMEEGGAAAGMAWLDARGIPWHMPPPKPLQPWKPDPKITRRILARDARSILR